MSSVSRLSASLSRLFQLSKDSIKIQEFFIEGVNNAGLIFYE